MKREIKDLDQKHPRLGIMADMKSIHEEVFNADREYQLYTKTVAVIDPTASSDSLVESEAAIAAIA